MVSGRFACFARRRTKSARYCGAAMGFVGVLVVCLRDLMATNVPLHETALMVHSYERFAGASGGVVSGVHLYRSKGHADMSLVLAVDRAIAGELGKMLGLLAHDVLVCVDVECNASEYSDRMQEVLLSARIAVGENASCSYGMETPLDVVSLATRSFPCISAIHPLQRSFGYPHVELVVPNAYVSGIHVFIGALNRMEHRFVHGPMLFEARNGNMFVSLPVLYTGFFLVFIPVMAQLISGIDLVLAVVVGLGYLNSWLSCLSLFYTLVCECSAANSAMLPFLLYCLSRVLTDAASVPEAVYAIVAVAALPPYVSLLSIWRFGALTLPVCLALLGHWVQRCVKSLM